jgi:hypothetical protein
MRALLPLGMLLGILASLLLATSESPGKTPRPIVGGFAPHFLAGEFERVTGHQDAVVRIDRADLLRDLSVLAHDSMEGRLAGTPGAARARRFLLAAFPESGVAPLNGTHVQTFPFRSAGTEAIGTNVIGVVRGREIADRYLVVTAHYDHLGTRGGEIYNGADDNASGTAALLALAKYFSGHPTRHSLLFVAFDAEEVGLRGAEAFMANPPIPLDSIVMNVNLDMVSRSEVGELYAVGTRHYPVLSPLIAEIMRRSRVSLLIGHDAPDPSPGDDWTFASDHGPFHQAGIPFIYFGVEDHPGYHTPADTYEAITPDFYLGAVETVLDFILLADESGEGLRRLPR